MRTWVSKCGSNAGVAIIPGSVPHLDGADFKEDGKKIEGRGRKSDRERSKGSRYRNSVVHR